MNYIKHKIWISSGDFILGALILACAWGKLSWGWFWGMVVIELLGSISFNSHE